MFRKLFSFAKVIEIVVCSKNEINLSDCRFGKFKSTKFVSKLLKKTNSLLYTNNRCRLPLPIH